MRILVFCAAGYSSSMIVSDLQKYAKNQNLAYDFTAKNAFDFEEKLEDGYDLVLLAPQISYKHDEIAKVTKIPIVDINSMDYALCNVSAICQTIAKYW